MGGEERVPSWNLSLEDIVEAKSKCGQGTKQPTYLPKLFPL